ncbi:taurine transporter subunit; ATP-binding component of ABC superfamily (modular protein) [Verrucomicrobia bacterium]|nr:taurine transporter subunit; ATP-binding component of ABC superfamily (modular protein) [Verrucomicrobiota bacterium]
MTDKTKTADTDGPAGTPVRTPATPDPATALQSTKISEKPATPDTGAAPNARPHVVVFNKVCKSFGHGAAAKVAIHDLSFVVEDAPAIGELVTIVGPSGCGKSTLLRMIAGLKPHFPPTSGEVLVFGKHVECAGPDRGLVDQKYSLLPHLTVVENIAFGLKLRGVSRSERKDQACEWVKKVGLDGFEDKFPSQLSGGMQQRVAIAATLILQPRILLMDEPFGALDPGIRLRMQELLIQLWNEKEETVFLVTHSVEEAVYLGDRVFLMAAKPGRLVEVLKVPRPNEPPEEIRRKKWFIDFCQNLLQRLEEESPAPTGVKV